MTEPSTNPQALIAGRYQVERRLARGGMADVYLATDQVLERQVAVKVLFDQYASDPKFVTRFRREAQSAGKLNHPNIVAVYDTGTDDGSYYIAMEYVDGATLADLLETEGSLSVDSANNIASEVAEGLAFAHGQGTVHRDVKPSNILITPDGTAKLTDFGIARAFTGDEDLTATGQVMGTATYFSPEQAQGFSVDPRSDLYSLGAVLFEMVTGAPPFSGTSPVNVAYKHVEEPAPLASTRRSDLPEDLDAIIDYLLAKAPDDRYRTATEVKADLDRLWNGEPIHGPTGQNSPVRNDDTATAALEPVPVRSSPQATKATKSGPTQTQAMPASALPENRPLQHPVQPPAPRTGWYVAAVAALIVGLIVVVIAISQGLFGTSPGPSGDLVAVPTVLGDSQAIATNRLADAGLVADVRFEPNDQVDPGTVFSQDPPARTEVEEGSSVQIIVSAADDLVDTPNVIDKTGDAARAELEALGFDVTITDLPSDTVEVGRVISQSIGSGETANLGALIVLFVSSGPDERAVPSVVNQLQSDAERQLRDQGFEVRAEQVDVDPNAGSDGRVISQTPSAGQEAAVGTVVVIQVGRIAETTTTSSSTTTTTPPTTTTTIRPTTTTTQLTTTTRPTTTAAPTTTTTTASTTTASTTTTTDAGANG